MLGKKVTLHKYTEHTNWCKTKFSSNSLMCRKTSLWINLFSINISDDTKLYIKKKIRFLGSYSKNSLMGVFSKGFTHWHIRSVLQRCTCSMQLDFLRKTAKTYFKVFSPLYSKLATAYFWHENLVFFSFKYRETSV